MSRIQPRVPKGSGDKSGEWTSGKGGLSASGKALQERTKAKDAKSAAAAAAAATTKRSDKSKAGHKAVTKAKAKVAFEGEQLIVEKMLNLAMTPAQFAVDGMVKLKGVMHGIEVKSLVDTKGQKVNMKQSSILKKLVWYAKVNNDHAMSQKIKLWKAADAANKKRPVGKRLRIKPIGLAEDHPHMHTISPDFRNGRPPAIYYRRGFGAYMQGTMTRVRNAAHLRRLIGMK